MAGKRPTGRHVKSHRSYEVSEIARALGITKATVRRWLKDGLPHLKDQRPFLILGSDLKAFLEKRRKPKQTCRIDECFCMSCKAPRRPALGEVEFHPINPHGGNLRALCEHCTTVMHKRLSVTKLDALRAILTVTDVQAETRLINSTKSPSNDHLKKEP